MRNVKEVKILNEPQNTQRNTAPRYDPDSFLPKLRDRRLGSLGDRRSSNSPLIKYETRGEMKRDISRLNTSP